ncbi:MAG: zinc-ribbon domain-containing protein [Clostridia bacterium]|nr:zinc-ribbon domain-containing protein [Clostridia bacterium]
MFCRECGKKVEEGNKFCTGCGAKIEPIKVVKKKEVEKPVEVIVKDEKQQESQTNNTNQATEVKDKVSIGFNILSFFVPIVGLILFLIYRKETPKRAKAMGICALIGYLLWMIITIVCIVFANTRYINYRYTNRYDNNYKYNYNYDYEYRYDNNKHQNIWWE